jgi:putative peptide zinc metalloprotease protein
MSEPAVVQPNADQKPPGQSYAERLRAVHAGLRSDLEVTRHLFRGQPQYVVRDPLTFQTHQFSQQDYQILAALNDSVSLGDVFQRLVDERRLEPAQEDDYYRFVLTLHQLNFLVLPMADGTQLYNRHMQRQRARRRQQLTGLLFLRIPLLNPDAFLERTVAYAKPLFSRAGLGAWFVMMSIALAILVQRWDSFRHPHHSILAGETLLFTWLALIGLKVVHEFGHAYACKVFGGKVPEMGAYLIAFTPCAYVDASAAWGFPRLRQRVIVSLAGMYVESIVAFFALLVWSWTDDLLISSCAHQVVVLSTAVTVLFNINPLMRYDGYYVLSDLTGTPNLRQRSLMEVQALLKRLIGIRAPQTTESAGQIWFLRIYGLLSSIYKVSLVLAICAMIAFKFYLVGIALAAMFLVTVVFGVVRQLLGYLWRSEETRPVRARAVVASAVLLLLIPGLAVLVPLQGTVVVSGITETSEDRLLYAPTSGFITGPGAPVGTRVRQNEVLCQLRNTVVQCRVAEAAAETDAAKVRYDSSLAHEPQLAAAEQIRWLNAARRQTQYERERDQLAIKSDVTGVVLQTLDERDTGRFVHKGDLVAKVGNGRWMVRCLATAEQISRARPRPGEQVRLRIVADGVQDVTGIVEEVAVKGTHQVFSPVLTQLGGGDIPVMPGTGESAGTLFEVRVRINDPESLRLLHGSRATVAFRSPPQTCGKYLYQRYHQFLNRLRAS